jgi:hypothetical protein
VCDGVRSNFSNIRFSRAITGGSRQIDDSSVVRLAGDKQREPAIGAGEGQLRRIDFNFREACRGLIALSSNGVGFVRSRERRCAKRKYPKLPVQKPAKHAVVLPVQTQKSQNLPRSNPLRLRRINSRHA